MPKNVGPERAHFGGEYGLITEQKENGKPKYFWRCSHCNLRIGDKIFPNHKARIHLSGDVSLRNGVISQVCTRAPEEVQKQFREIIARKAEVKKRKDEIRKRARELTFANLQASPAKQSELSLKHVKELEDEEVDDSWGRAFFALDIAHNKIGQPFFRQAIEATKRVKAK